MRSKLAHLLLAVLCHACTPLAADELVDGGSPDSAAEDAASTGATAADETGTETDGDEDAATETTPDADPGDAGARPEAGDADSGHRPESDEDGDNVPDATDNCPSVSNPGQEDHDMDGLGDACDGDGDGDGLANADDRCPLGDVGGEDTDGDGCLDLGEDDDDDDDGVPDPYDACPLTAPAPGADLDGDGCPVHLDACPLGHARLVDGDGDGCSDLEDPAPEDEGLPGTPTIVYVRADQQGATQNGSSWGTAFRHLQDGLESARTIREAVDAPPVQVWVASGTYHPDDGAGVTEGDPEASFEMQEGVGIYGGFRFDAAAGAWTRDALEETVLSGDLGDDDTPTEWPYIWQGTNSCQVVVDASPGKPTIRAVLDGVVVRSGVAGCGDQRGVAISTSGGSDFVDVAIELNYVWDSWATGAVLHVAGSSRWLGLRMRDNITGGGQGTFAGTDGPGDVHAVLIALPYQWPVVIHNAQLTSLSALQGTLLQVRRGDVEVVNTAVRGNRMFSNADSLIDVTGGSLSLRHVSVSGNSTGSSSALLEVGSSISVDLSNSLIWGNEGNAGLSSQGLVEYTSTVFEYAESGPEGLLTSPTESPFVARPLPGDAPTNAGDLHLADRDPNYTVDLGSDEGLSCPELLRSALPQGVDPPCDNNNRLLTDLDGNPRSQGAWPDLGAYETPAE